MKKATDDAGSLGSPLSAKFNHTRHSNAVKRYAAVLAMRRNGKTLRAIAAEIGVSHERVRQMERLAKHEELLAIENPHHEDAHHDQK